MEVGLEQYEIKALEGYYKRPVRDNRSFDSKMPLSTQHITLIRRRLCSLEVK